MIVTLLSDDFPPTSFGGAGISTFELAGAIQASGHHVSVITTCRDERDVGVSEYEGVTVYKILSDYPPLFRAYKSLYNTQTVKEVKVILKNVKPDIVHANNIHNHLSYHSLLIAKKYAKGVIITMRDTMSITYGKLGTKKYLNSKNPKITWIDNLKQARKRWNPFRNFIIRLYLKSAHKVVAISESLKDSLVKNGIRDVSVIHNGININEWEKNTEKCEAFRNHYNLNGKKILFFSGRLSNAKGGEQIIRALSIIQKELKNVVLLVAGTESSYTETMKAVAKELKVEKSVVFTGWLDRKNIKTAYAVSDVVLMTSVYLDAFGRVNIEAMASKKPVVGTCYGGTPEIVVDGITGYIINPLYVEEIAKKTLDLLIDPAKARQFGEAGYRRACSDFNLKDVANKYIRVYTKLLE